MGDVRVPTVATLLAAMVAVVGSIVAVWLSGRQQRLLQVRAFAEQRRAQNAQWDDEKIRAARATEFDACVQFDAAVVIAINRLQQVASLAGRPRLRRYLLGRDWAQQWQTRVRDAAEGLALPYSAVTLGAGRGREGHGRPQYCGQRDHLYPPVRTAGPVGRSCATTMAGAGGRRHQ